MIYWNPSPIAFEILSIEVRWYGLLFIVGLILGKYFITKIMVKEASFNHYSSFILFNYIMIGTILGGRLVHCLFYNPKFYLSNPLQIFSVWGGGMSSHGGYLGLILAIYLFSKKYPVKNFLWLLDVIIPFTVFTGALIRIGNMINSEIVGHTTNGSWGIVFERIDKLPRHPVQLYEALGYFVVSFIGMRMRRNKNMRDGWSFLFIGLSALSIRLFSEFFKTDRNAGQYLATNDIGIVLSIMMIAFILAYSKMRGHSYE